MKNVNQTKIENWEQLNREMENIRKLLVDQPYFSGDGTPDGIVYAKVGAYYLDTLKGIMYCKESGDGTKTGWLRLGFELPGVPKFYAGSVANWNATLTDGTTLYTKNRHMFCNGASVSISSYQDLYDNIGTTWNLCAKQDGAGGNYTKPSSGFFRIPDLRGVFLRGAGTSSLADGSGDVTVTLGAFTNDQFQGFQVGASNGGRTFYGYSWVTDQFPTYLSSGTGFSTPMMYTETKGDGRMMTAVDNGTNGTPRTGIETAPKNVGINYVITY